METIQIEIISKNFAIDVKFHETLVSIFNDLEEKLNLSFSISENQNERLISTKTEVHFLRSRILPELDRLINSGDSKEIENILKFDNLSFIYKLESSNTGFRSTDFMTFKKYIEGI